MGNKLRHEGDEVRIKVIWPDICILIYPYTYIYIYIFRSPWLRSSCRTSNSWAPPATPSARSWAMATASPGATQASGATAVARRMVSVEKMDGLWIWCRCSERKMIDYIYIYIFWKYGYDILYTIHHTLYTILYTIHYIIHYTLYSILRY